jgi:hypothetical protein
MSVSVGVCARAPTMQNNTTRIIRLMGTWRSLLLFFFEQHSAPPPESAYVDVIEHKFFGLCGAGISQPSHHAAIMASCCRLLLLLCLACSVAAFIPCDETCPDGLRPIFRTCECPSNCGFACPDGSTPSLPGCRCSEPDDCKLRQKRPHNTGSQAQYMNFQSIFVV